MNSTRFLLASSVLLAAATIPAQVVTFGGNGQREHSSVFFYDQGARKFLGGIELTYGAPAWRADYEKITTAKSDSAMRLGKDGWATLNNSVAITLGGTRIPSGQWYLGLARRGGQFHLMVMPAQEIRAKKVLPTQTAELTAKIHAPLQHAKVEAVASKLSMTAAPGKKKAHVGTFTLHWGQHRLTAPLIAELAATGKGDAAKPGK